MILSFETHLLNITQTGRDKSICRADAQESSSVQYNLLQESVDNGFVLT